jgi:hypothetical protein
MNVDEFSLKVNNFRSIEIEFGASDLPLALIAALCTWTLPLFNFPKAAIFSSFKFVKSMRLIKLETPLCLG